MLIFAILKSKKDITKSIYDYMKKIYIILILFPFLTFSQSWTNVSNFIGDGRHHPITFSNDDYGFVVSGSYLNDVFKYDNLPTHGLNYKIFQDLEEDIPMVYQLVIKHIWVLALPITGHFQPIGGNMI